MFIDMGWRAYASPPSVDRFRDGTPKHQAVDVFAYNRVYDYLPLQKRTFCFCFPGRLVDGKTEMM